MKNLIILIFVILLGGVTYAQDCNPAICDGCCDVFEPETPDPVVFDFNTETCGEETPIIDFDAVKTELNDVVDLFFEELRIYNQAYTLNADGTINPAGVEDKENKVAQGLFPFDGIVAEDYNVTIETFSFTYGAAADVSKSQNGSITDITININEDKYHELSNDEYYEGYELDSYGRQITDNNGNPVPRIRALAYLKKRMIIFHELGHAVLGLDHPCNTEADIMNTSQCPRADGSQYNLSFPDDFPVANITPWENAVNRMFLGTQGGQVLLPESSSTTSSSSSSAATPYTISYTAAAAAQAPRERYDGETDLEYYGDTDLTNDQLQNRVDAIDAISKPETATVKYGWEPLNQVYFIQITDLLYEPIVSEVAAVANLTTLTYSEFEDLVDWTIEWRAAFISKIANNHLD